jgi:hypothetical protein
MPVRLLVPRLLLFAVLAGCAIGPAAVLHRLPYPVVFTEVPESRPVKEGGRLVVLDNGGTVRVLTAQFAAAADPNVSFDGKRILFAAKKDPGDLWNVFEMNADGSAVRQITRGRGNCRRPAYQSAIFYLNDARPSYQVTFVSDADEMGGAAESGRSLYSVRLDGSGLRRLTYTLSDSYDPFQMQDGRILFSGQRPGGADLFAIHMDGADYSAFSGPQGRRIKHMPCVTAGGIVAFIESDRPLPDGAGSVGSIRMRRNLHSYKAVTLESDGLYLSPSPESEGSVLISRKSPQPGAVYGIYRLDLQTGKRTLLLERSGAHSVQAVALAPRPEPDGHSSVVEDDQNWAKLYCLSVYENDLKPGWMPLGTARRVRFLEGVPATVTPGGRKAAIPTRLLGYAPLEEDGSFHVLVPPNTPIRVQILDSDDLALRSGTWIWAKNKENRGCIGCHEDGERTPENVFAKALGRPAVNLMLPSERRRTADFQREISPIFAEKCGNRACHARGVPLALGRYVDPGQARTSRLVWALFGRNTSRPWDRSGPTAPVKKMPPAGSPQLTIDERRAIVEWIDMGAPGTPPSPLGGKP